MVVAFSVVIASSAQPRETLKEIKLVGKMLTLVQMFLPIPI